MHTWSRGYTKIPASAQALIREKNANTVKRHTSKNNCRNRNR